MPKDNTPKNPDLRYPVAGNTYTLTNIKEHLALDDTPHLRFHYKGRLVVIQGTVDQLAAVPGALESKWQYIRTTDEWIPLFDNIENDAILQFVDIEREIDPTKSKKDLGWWVTPKGTTILQYYAQPENR